MSTLIYDEARLLQTAHAVQLVNPYARNYSLDALVDNMKATARRAFDGGSDGYVSTLGYVLTVFTADDGSRNIYSSVASYSVIEHAKNVVSP